MDKKTYIEQYEKYEKPASTLFHKYFSKKFAKFFTFYFIKLKLTPNILSILTFILVISGSAALNFFDGVIGSVIFAFFLQLSYVLDCSDGVVARITNKSSPFGAYLDITLDRLNICIVYVGIGIYFHTNYGFDLASFLVFISSALIYIQYQLMALLRAHYFKSLDGFMKESSKDSISKKIVSVVYEFIDTGIFYFILSLSVFFNLIYEVVIFYGLIGFMLVLALYIFLYKKSYDPGNE